MFNKIVEKVKANQELNLDEEILVYKTCEGVTIDEKSMTFTKNEGSSWHKSRLRAAMEKSIAGLSTSTPEKQWLAATANHSILLQHGVYVDLELERKLHILKYERPNG